MIIPISDETTWQPLLKGLPSWMPSTRSMLVVSPHPDDETLGVGGLIASQAAAGVPVVLAAVTDGENAYEGVSGLGPIREEEQRAAAALLGIPASAIHRFRLTDSGVSDHHEELVARLLALTTSETHILAPWPGDFHPDHAACGLAAKEVSERTGARVTSYFFWSWHLAPLNLLESLPLASFPLTRQALSTKLAALACHRSQLEWESGAPILPKALLGPAHRPVEVLLG